MSERSHVHPVFLPVELYVGVSKVQAKLEIGKSATLLLLINEGLYYRGFMDEEHYEKLKEKYERPLVDIVKRTSEAKSLAEQESIKKRQKLNKLELQLSGVLEQWDLHPDRAWRSLWIEKARPYTRELRVAQLIVDLETEQNPDLRLRNGESDANLIAEFTIRKFA